MAIDVSRDMRKIIPHLIQARADGLTEADTVSRVAKVFESVLGYDSMTDISGEARIKGKFIDLVLKIDGVIKILCEVKAANEKLRERHIDQAQAYAAKGNYHWVILTNGIDWNLYHLTFSDGIDYRLLFQVDLADDSKIKESCQKLSVVHKQSVKKGNLEEFWEVSNALNPESIGLALRQEEVLSIIRREIRKEEGKLIDIEDLYKSIRSIISPEHQAAMGPAKIQRRKRQQKQELHSTTPSPEAIIDRAIEQEIPSNITKDV